MNNYQSLSEAKEIGTKRLDLFKESADIKFLASMIEIAVNLRNQNGELTEEDTKILQSTRDEFNTIIDRIIKPNKCNTMKKDGKNTTPNKSPMNKQDAHHDKEVNPMKKDDQIHEDEKKEGDKSSTEWKTWIKNPFSSDKDKSDSDKDEENDVSTTDINTSDNATKPVPSTTEDTNQDSVSSDKSVTKPNM